MMFGKVDHHVRDVVLLVQNRLDPLSVSDGGSRSAYTCSCTTWLRMGDLSLCVTHDGKIVEPLMPLSVPHYVPVLPRKNHKICISMA
jgi:hypothetical protein